MRHYPAYCPDCRRLWLVATPSAPSASPGCPRCKELGRLVPGAYYSEPASLVFIKLEQALHSAALPPKELARLATELEQLLPSPTEAQIDQSFEAIMRRLDLLNELSAIPGKRVALRMIVTIAGTLSQPVVRESGVMLLPQAIRGLFEVKPSAPTAAGPGSDRPGPKLKS